ncbi:PKD domain-containing protein [Flavobacterium sp.]|uniref:PKD domain-containing protein n=1 Tax=Flavobacterium sp. TaxID=239 RepID=UPI003BAA548E
MDLTVDFSCQNLLTAGQISRLHFFLDPEIGVRRQLLDNPSCVDCGVFYVQQFQVTPILDNKIYQVSTGVIPSVSIQVQSALGASASYNAVLIWLEGQQTISLLYSSSSSFVQLPANLNVGNYRLQITATNQSNAECTRLMEYSFQVIPPIEPCVLNSPLDNTNWGSVERVSYSNGWTYDENLQLLAGANRTVLANNQISSDFNVIPLGNSLNDVNFSQVTNAPTTGSAIIRVGAIPNSQVSLSPGRANYVKIKFNPTAANCRFKINFLGAVENTFTQQGIKTIPYYSYNLKTSTSKSAGFGYFSQYKFNSPLTVNSTVPKIIGLGEFGNVNQANIGYDPSNYYGVNDMLSCRLNSSVSDFQGTGSLKFMNSWRSTIIDFSEFIDYQDNDPSNINLNTEITLTFFAHSNDATNASAAAYFYFNIECIGGGLPTPVDFDIPNIQLDCGARRKEILFKRPDNKLFPTTIESTNITSETAPVTKSFLSLSIQQITPISQTIPLQIFELTDDSENLFRINPEFVTTSQPLSGIGNYIATFKTLRKIIERPFTVNFVPLDNWQPTCENPSNLQNIRILNCKSSLDSSDNVTVPLSCTNSQSQFWRYHPEFTTTSEPHCTGKDLIFTNPFPITTVATVFRRRSTFTNPYCGTKEYVTEPDVIYYTPTAKKINFEGVTSTDLCAFGTINVKIAKLELDLTAIPTDLIPASNNNAVLTLKLYKLVGNQKLYIGNSSTISSISSLLLGENILFSSPNVLPNGSIIFDNLGGNSLHQVGLEITKNLYGCNQVEDIFPFTTITVDPSAIAGEIQKSGNCPPLNIISINDGVTYPGYKWQYKNSINSQYVDIPNAPNTANLDDPVSYFTTFPVFIRRVSTYFGECSQDLATDPVEINSFNPVEPSFNLPETICQGQSVPILPPKSLNGIFGTWNPAAINPNQLGIQNFVFTPNENQCSTPVNYSVVIDYFTNLTLNVRTTLCSSALPYRLRDISNEGYQGTWSFNGNPVTHVLEAGVYTFTPLYSQYLPCVPPVSLQITVIDVEEPVFPDFPSTFCQDEVFYLPESLNGVAGSWSENPVYTSFPGSHIIYFTPEATPDCGTSTKTITVLAPYKIPTFSFPTNLCEGAPPPSLPLISNNNISGTWNPPIINNSISGNYTFTPILGQCGVPINVSITIGASCDLQLQYSSTVRCEDGIGRDEKDTDFSNLQSTECIVSCQGSSQFYLLFGNTSQIANIQWNIIGGQVVSTTPVGVTVQWSSVSSNGNIGGVVTFLDGSTTTIDICVELIEVPEVLATIQGIVPAPNLRACIQTPVNFQNLTSIGGGNGTAYYLWDFGDGNTSTLFEPQHAYQAEGDYRVTLRVYNGCACSSSYSFNIRVSGEQLVISCETISCPGQIAIYSIPNDYYHCNNIIWTVQGGTLLSTFDNGTKARIKWGTTSADGFGYVTVNTNSCLCRVPTTIKVPLLTNSFPIEGPTTLCPEQQQMFKLPQWPATEFTWTVIGATGDVSLNFTRQRNEILVTADPNVTFTLRCVYKNTLFDCGGSTSLSINSNDEYTLQGNLKVCVNTPLDLVVLNSSGNAESIQWEITGPQQFLATGSSSAITSTLTMPGIYKWRPNFPGCNVAEVDITVMDKPITPVLINGNLDSVCPNNNEIYSVTVPTGNQVEWEVVNGEILGDSRASSIKVVWDEAVLSSQGLIKVRIMKGDCTGEFFEQIITPLSIESVITGPELTYSNADTNFEVDFIGYDSITWSIENSLLGSLISSQNQSTATISWNVVAAPTTTVVKALIKKCGIEKTIEKEITIIPTPQPTIIAPSNACANETVNFAISLPEGFTADTVVWTFPNGATATGNSVNYTFENNPQQPTVLSTSVQVHCTSPANLYLTQMHETTVYPIPNATVSTNFVADCNPILETDILTVTIEQGFAQTYAVKWFKVTPTGNQELNYTSATLSIIDVGFGGYYAEVTNNYGCTFKTNKVTISPNCNPGPECALELDFSTTVSCSTVTAIPADIPNIQEIYWSLNKPGGTQVESSIVQFVQTDLPVGAYGLTMRVIAQLSDGSTCSDKIDKSFEIPFKPFMRHEITCMPNGQFQVKLLDSSVKLETVTLNNIQFKINNGAWQTATLNATTNTYELLQTLAPGNYTIAMRASTNGVNWCEAAPREIQLSVPATPLFTVNGTACQKQAVGFTVTNPDQNLTYTWDFGDDSSSNIINASRSYENAVIYDVVLTATNALGCSSSYMQQVSVVAVKLQGTIAANPENSCEGANVSLVYTPDPGQDMPSAFNWFKDSLNNPIGTTTINTFTANSSGYYFVHVQSAAGCEVFDNTGGNVNQTPQPSIPQIDGELTVCAGDDVVLSSPIKPNMQFFWKWNGESVYPDDNNSITISNAADGDVVELTTVLNNLQCESPTQTVTLHVIDRPAEPVVELVAFECEPYMATLQIVNPASGVQYLWSDGSSGLSRIFDHPGPISVTAIKNGCSSTWEGDLPVDGESLMWIVPTGCYQYCDKPEGYLIGPYGEYEFASWQQFEQPIAVNTSSVVANLPLPVEPVLGIRLEIQQQGCTYQSSTFSAIVNNCNDCPFKIKTITILQQQQVEKNCNWILELIITNDETYMQYATLNEVSGLFSFLPVSIAIPPGISQHIIQVLGDEQLANSSYNFTLEGIVGDRPCASEFSIELPSCAEKRPASDTDIQATDNFTILALPKPFTDVLSVWYNLPNNTGEKILQITDLRGRIIATSILNEAKGKADMNLDHLEAGIYLLTTLINNQLWHVQKIVKH